MEFYLSQIILRNGCQDSRKDLKRFGKIHERIMNGNFKIPWNDNHGTMKMEPWINMGNAKHLSILIQLFY